MIVTVHQKREISLILLQQRRSPGMYKPRIQRHHGKSSMVIGLSRVPSELRKVDESGAPPMKVWIIKHQASAQWRRSPVNTLRKLFQEVKERKESQPKSSVEMLIDDCLHHELLGAQRNDGSRNRPVVPKEPVGLRF